jgi:hypothetical protein
MGSLWTLVTVLGPVLLIGTIIWATLRNRSASRADIASADLGARKLREEIERDEAKDGVP